MYMVIDNSVASYHHREHICEDARLILILLLSVNGRKARIDPCLILLFLINDPIV